MVILSMVNSETFPSIFHSRAGLTGGFDEARRVEFIIPDEARKAGVAHYYIEASCNEMFGQNGMDPPDQNRYYRLNSADLVVPNMEAWRVLWDFDTLHQLVNDLPGDSSLAKRAMWAANEMMNVFEEGNPESLPRCRKVAEMVLGEGWSKEIEEDSKSASKQTGTLWAIGHWYVPCVAQVLTKATSTLRGYGRFRSHSRNPPDPGLLSAIF
jgi:alpha-mannosidase